MSWKNQIKAGLNPGTNQTYVLLIISLLCTVGVTALAISMRDGFDLTTISGGAVAVLLLALLSSSVDKSRFSGLDSIWVRLLVVGGVVGGIVVVFLFPSLNPFASLLVANLWLGGTIALLLICVIALMMNMVDDFPSFGFQV